MKNHLAKFSRLNPFNIVILTALTLLFLPNAIAGTLNGPSASTTGSYTISSTGDYCNESYLSYQLRENNVTVQSSCSISKSFNDKPTGVYHYALFECEYDPEVNYRFCTPIDSHSVTVSRVAGVNPNGDIAVRLGDYNNDGLSDIFVKSPIMAPYLLKRTPTNSFQLITGLSTVQINGYSNWGIATQILAYVSDLNIDGTDDMMLIGISNHIPAAADQIIHSQYNGSVYTTPASATALTASSKRFLIETLGLSQDRNYLLRTMINNGAYSLTSHGYTYAFFNTAYLKLFQMGMNGNIYVGLDENPYDDATPPSNCAIYSCIYDTIGGQWQMYVYAEVIETTWDYSIFHPSTVALDIEIAKVEAGDSTLDKLLDIFESQVGYVSCNGIEDDQVDVFDHVHNFSYFKTNTCTFALLARFINAFSYKALKEIGDNKMQFRANRIGYNWWNPFFHASISDPEHSEWYSGMPFDGLLFGFYKYPEDNPDLTLLAGFISSVLTIADVNDTIYRATTFYDNKLEYSAFPTSFTSGYNSNSFAKGLVNLVGSIKPLSALAKPFSATGIQESVTISISSSRFPGLDKPVPKGDFGY